MGVLRQYVKQRKNELKKENGNNKVSSKLTSHESNRLSEVFKGHIELFDEKDFI